MEGYYRKLEGIEERRKERRDGRFGGKKTGRGKRGRAGMGDKR